MRIEHNLISNKWTVFDSNPSEEDVSNKTMDTGAILELDYVVSTDFGPGFNLMAELQQHR